MTDLTATTLTDAPRVVPTVRAALPHIVAQGGNAAEFPRNTLPAIRSALELGCAYIQFDVQLSGDGIPVVVRDHWVITAAPPRSVFAMRADDVSQQCAHEPDHFGERFADVRIPTLTQVVELLEAFPRAHAFVQLQSASLNRFGHETVIDRVRRALRDIADRTVLVTAELLALDSVRRRSAQPVGWVAQDYSTLSALKCEAIAPDFVICDEALLPPSQRVWRGPWQFIASDVAPPSTSDALQSLASHGVGFLQSAEVRALLRLRRGKAW